MITCEHISFSYEKIQVVSDLSFQLEKGAYLAVLGDNGTGKSTLLKGIAGLHHPTEGRIDLKIEKRKIGYLPQQAGIQKNFPASVEEVVLSGRVNQKGFHPFFTKKDKESAEKAMEQMGVSHLKHNSFGQLSGGQQRRVLLARALCSDFELLLLDEPIAGLDPTASEEFYRLIGSLNHSGITVVMVSHDVSRVLQDATHVLWMGHDSAVFSTSEEYGGDRV